MTPTSQGSQIHVAPARPLVDDWPPSTGAGVPRALVACLLLLSSLSAIAESAAHDSLDKMILGSWRESVVMGEVSSSGISVYSPDSTVTHQIKAVAPGLTLEIRTRSRWRIEGSELITEVTESSRPDAIPVGAIERDTIVSMERNRWVYRDSDGVEVTAIRVEDDEASGN